MVDVKYKILGCYRIQASFFLHLRQERSWYLYTDREIFTTGRFNHTSPARRSATAQAPLPRQQLHDSRPSPRPAHRRASGVVKASLGSQTSTYRHAPSLFKTHKDTWQGVATRPTVSFPAGGAKAHHALARMMILAQQVRQTGK